MGETRLLASLRSRLAAGGDPDLACAEFWRAVAGQGTPLVEPLEGGKNGWLVTFVWRGAPSTRAVALSCYPGWDPLVNQLHLVPGTDVWAKTYEWPDGVRQSYHFVVDHPTLVAGAPWPVKVAKLRDPFNRQPVDTVDGEVSLVTLPGAASPIWTADLGSQKGRVTRRRWACAGLGNERDVAIYEPPVMPAEQATVPVAIFLDGQWFEERFRLFTMLDNLIAQGLIPPLVAVTVDSIDMATRQVELFGNDAFVGLVCDAIVPYVRAVTGAGANQRDRLVCGLSSGGAGATWLASQRPDVFGGVLSQSGSFWLGPGGSGGDYWLPRFLARSPRLPLRLYLDAGLFEMNSYLPLFQPVTTDIMLQSNRHLRDVLTAKGYEFAYREFPGGHDFQYWPITLPDGLAYLLKPAGVAAPVAERHPVD